MVFKSTFENDQGFFKIKDTKYRIEGITADQFHTINVMLNRSFYIGREAGARMMRLTAIASMDSEQERLK